MHQKQITKHTQVRGSSMTADNLAWFLTIATLIIGAILIIKLLEYLFSNKHEFGENPNTKKPKIKG